MSGDLNMPFEELPDGPIETDVDVVLCGGCTVRAATFPLDNGAILPALVWDFYTASGEKLGPLCLVMTDGEMLAFAEMAAKAARSAVRHARDEFGRRQP